MSAHAIQLTRLILVIALVSVAAALATPPGRLPLALRGLQRLMRRDRGLAPDAATSSRASLPRRLLAFFLLIAAALLAVI